MRFPLQEVETKCTNFKAHKLGDLRLARAKLKLDIVNKDTTIFVLKKINIWRKKYFLKKKVYLEKSASYTMFCIYFHSQLQWYF